jgi:hypothetical protein
MEIFVISAWIAGLQVRTMRPETSMSAWIPALHAGMTHRGVVLKLTKRLPTSRIFREGYEGFGFGDLKLRVLRGDIPIWYLGYRIGAL